MATIINAVVSVFSTKPDDLRHGQGGEARMVAAWLGRRAIREPEQSSGTGAH
jgi:hypothetical protein